MALRSIQSEMSNVFSSLPVFLTPECRKGDNMNKGLKFLLIIPYIIHIYRYYTNFEKSYIISKKQKGLYLLNILDYIVIYLHVKTQSLKCPTGVSAITLVHSIISGFISFYFIYNEYPVEGSKGIANPIMDIPMILFSLIILYNSSEPNLHFFAIRELVYHILEIMVYYRN
jgi:hypothetical protein